jgi:hypothetical protein
MARVLQPPAPLVWDASREFSIFLAGSIEQGTAPDWQSALANELQDVEAVLLNPRREKWDALLPHDDTPGSVFEQQVQWELEALERADVIAVYFVPGTLSPITLLELGLHARSGRLVVCCPPATGARATSTSSADAMGLPRWGRSRSSP